MLKRHNYLGLAALVGAALALSIAGAYAQDANAPDEAGNADGAAAVKAPEDMVHVPGGPFIMGTNQEERMGDNAPRLYSDAQPRHETNVPAFFIDKTEVTNADYKKYCDATGYPPPPHWKGNAFPEGQGNFPVTHVNWWEATAYAAWSGKRLPTETEWEKAARGTDERVFPWGNEWDADKVVWGQRVTHPEAVGTRPAGASPYGALDMAGNVMEWVSDWYAAYPGAKHAFPEFGTFFKVVRGGMFSGFEMIDRTYYRSVARQMTRSEFIGFRCAKDAK